MSEESVETPVAEEAAPAADTKKLNGARNKTGGRRKEKIVIEMENAEGHWLPLDEGPDNEGFAGQAQALEALKAHVNAGVEGAMLDAEHLPTFRVIRIVREVAPSLVKRVEIDFGDE